MMELAGAAWLVRYDRDTAGFWVNGIGGERRVLLVYVAVARVEEIEFARVRDLLEVSDSMLSKAVAALVEAGIVSVRKAARDGRQRTWIAFTPAGRRAYAAHVAALVRLAAGD